jgi:hypothetical protein
MTTDTCGRMAASPARFRSVERCIRVSRQQALVFKAIFGCAQGRVNEGLLPDGKKIQQAGQI